MNHKLTSVFIAVLLLGLTQPVSAEWKHKTRSGRSPLVARTAHSYQYGLGIAFGAGVYSGINGSMNMGRNRFIQAQVGIRILQAKLGSTADYVMEFPQFISATTVPYVGAGALFVLNDDYASLISDSSGNMHFGLRAPIGIYTLLSSFPLQFYGEAIPGLLLVSEAVLTFGVNAGFRWLFH